MKRLFEFTFVFCSLLVLGGCPASTNVPINTDSPEPYVTCEEAVAYIATADAALAAIPPALPNNTEEVALVKAWWTVARTGATVYLSKKCPEQAKALLTQTGK